MDIPCNTNEVFPPFSYHASVTHSVVCNTYTWTPRCIAWISVGIHILCCFGIIMSSNLISITLVTPLSLWLDPGFDRDRPAFRPSTHCCSTLAYHILYLHRDHKDSTLLLPRNPQVLFTQVGAEFTAHHITNQGVTRLAPIRQPDRRDMHFASICTCSNHSQQSISHCSTTPTHVFTLTSISRDHTRNTIYDNYVVNTYTHRIDVAMLHHPRQTESSTRA